MTKAEDNATAQQVDDEVVVAQLVAIAEDVGWDWTDDAEHDPSDRFAIIRLGSDHYVVYRGVEPDRAWHCGTARLAQRWMRELIDF